MPIVCLDPIDVQGTGRPDGYARMDALPTALATQLSQHPGWPMFHIQHAISPYNDQHVAQPSLWTNHLIISHETL